MSEGSGLKSHSLCSNSKMAVTHSDSKGRNRAVRAAKKKMMKTLRRSKCVSALLPGEYQTKIVHRYLRDYLDRNVNFLTHVVWKLDRQPFLDFIHCRYQVPSMLPETFSDIP